MGSFIRMPTRTRHMFPRVVLALAVLALSLPVGAETAARLHALRSGSLLLMPGDARARHKVQMQADRGCIRAPITTWPISASDLSGCQEVSAHDAASASESSIGASGTVPGSTSRAGLRLGVNSDQNIFRYFADQPRERAEASLWLEHVRRNESADPTFAVHLEATAVDPFGDETEHWRADGSWLAAFPGNWIVGAGAVDRWWGPGWFSSLAVSTNARPVPGIWLAREQARQSDSRWFKWLGPWHFTFFAGQLESDRTVPHAKLLGARFTFRPTQRLEIGLTRTAQWGGEGRPEDGSSLWNLIIGRDNGETSGFDEGEDPGNQLGGLDFRYGRALGENAFSLYGQMMGDDEANALPTRFSILVGADLATHVGRGSQRWVLEGANTVGGGWLGESKHLVTYEHGTYRTGYRYHGRTIASTFERDSQVITVGAWQFFANGHTAYANFSVIDINRADTLRASALEDSTPVLATPERQQGRVLGAGWSFPLRQSRVTVSAQHFDEPLVTVEGELPQTLWSASWEIPL